MDRVARASKVTGQAESPRPEGESQRPSELAPFYHYACLTLPHLIALVSRTTSRLIPNNTSLVILDSATALINSALPKAQEGKLGMDMKRGKFCVNHWNDAHCLNRRQPIGQAKTGAPVYHEVPPDFGLHKGLRSGAPLSVCHQNAVRERSYINAGDKC